MVSFDVHAIVQRLCVRVLIGAAATGQCCCLALPCVVQTQKPGGLQHSRQGWSQSHDWQPGKHHQPASPLQQIKTLYLELLCMIALIGEMSTSHIILQTSLHSMSRLV